MSNSIGIGPTATSTILDRTIGTMVPASTAGKDSPEAIQKAASSFESLLIGEILKSSREAGGDGGWLGTGEDADSGLGELAEQQLAQALASNGGLGLAKMIGVGLKKAAKGSTGSSQPVGKNS